jgi:NADH:ubiquinone reductase (H+-translocating)
MHVVIIGAGFGGLKLARMLNNKKDFSVTLIDKNNYHQFQPLFYQVATAGLDASNISFPLRKVFHKSKNVKVRLAEVQQIDTNLHQVHTSIGIFSYDKLVIATGADTNFFGNSVLEKAAFPMKSTVEALQIRHQLIQNFETILHTHNVVEREALMNIVVVGGGPTGLETSGAIADLKKYVLPKDYPEIDFSKLSIYLIEGSGRVLGSMSEKSSKNALAYIEKLGVKTWLNTIVANYDGTVLTTQDGRTINTKLLIWAAGIKGNRVAGIGGTIAKGNRIEVDRYCNVIGTKDVFAIGDVAYMVEENYPNGHPQVAPTAMQQAQLLAQNFIAQNSGKGIKQFSYRDKGSMATIGRNLAVVDVPKPKWHIKGFLAWLIWMGLHLMLILGVKNRFFVFLNWLYNYITYDQNLRLIFKEFYRHPEYENKKAVVS